MWSVAVPIRIISVFILAFFKGLEDKNHLSYTLKSSALTVMCCGLSGARISEDQNSGMKTCSSVTKQLKTGPARKCSRKATELRDEASCYQHRQVSCTSVTRKVQTPGPRPSISGGGTRHVSTLTLLRVMPGQPGLKQHLLLAMSWPLGTSQACHTQFPPGLNLPTKRL